jgi:PilZ domain
MERASGRPVRLPRDTSLERRTSTRFPLTLAVRYAVSDRRQPGEMGSGRTMDLSSSGLCFSTDTPLSPGQRLDVSIDWPALLDGGVHLQLIISGVVVRTNGTVTAVQIQRHEFRTRRVGLQAVASHASGG